MCLFVIFSTERREDQYEFKYQVQDVFRISNTGSREKQFLDKLSLEFHYFFQVDKVLSVAENVKNIGNTLFKNQDWKAAVNKYSKALR